MQCLSSAAESDCVFLHTECANVRLLSHIILRQNLQLLFLGNFRRSSIPGDRKNFLELVKMLLSIMIIITVFSENKIAGCLPLVATSEKYRLVVLQQFIQSGDLKVEGIIFTSFFPLLFWTMR